MKKTDEEILLDAGLGYTDREIADRHATTPGAIRVRLSRLRHKLRRALLRIPSAAGRKTAYRF